MEWPEHLLLYELVGQSQRVKSKQHHILTKGTATPRYQPSPGVDIRVCDFTHQNVSEMQE